jgi:hypothetical protein
VASPLFQKSNNTAKSSTALFTWLNNFIQYSLTFISFKMDVARALSSQKPVDSDIALSCSTF